MPTTTHDSIGIDGSGVASGVSLADVRGLRAVREAAELAQVNGVLAWCEAHQTPREDSASTVAGVPWVTGSHGLFGQHQVPLGGEGAPWVEEFAVVELATALRMTLSACQAYVGQALELRYRLPKLHARMQRGEVAVWRALRIAGSTVPLAEAAAWSVDAQLAPYAHSTSWAAVDRTVAAALAAHDPEEAARQRAVAAEDRGVWLDLDTAGRHGTDGTVTLEGRLDLPDALDLDEALRRGARHLADLGSQDPLQVRRSTALGDLARAQLALDLPTTSHHVDTAPTPTSTASSIDGTAGRSVVLYVHLADEVTATVGNHRGTITLAQVRSWCGQATKVVLKPVIDTAACDPVDPYAIPTRHREQVELRNPTCVFPYCHRPARACDCDHIQPHPDGPTCPCNLAPLCRRHHRAKTHAGRSPSSPGRHDPGGFTYAALEPGVYLWHTPSGLTFLVDRHGTHDLTTPPDG